MLFAQSHPLTSKAVLPSPQATSWHLSSREPAREITPTVGAHRGAICRGTVVRAGPFSSSSQHRRRLSGSTRGLDINKPRSDRARQRVLVVGIAFFVVITAAWRSLFGSVRGLDIDPPPELPRGTAQPRHRRHPLRRHHRGIIVVCASARYISLRPFRLRVVAPSRAPPTHAHTPVLCFATVSSRSAANLSCYGLQRAATRMVAPSLPTY